MGSSAQLVFLISGTTPIFFSPIKLNSATVDRRHSCSLALILIKEYSIRYNVTWGPFEAKI